MRHAHLRSSCLARNLLVVDEVHASDTYMTAVLKSLLEAHINAGGSRLAHVGYLGVREARLAWLSTARRPQDRPALSQAQATAEEYPAVSSPDG